MGNNDKQKLIMEDKAFLENKQKDLMRLKLELDSCLTYDVVSIDCIDRHTRFMNDGSECELKDLKSQLKKLKIVTKAYTLEIQLNALENQQKALEKIEKALIKNAGSFPPHMSWEDMANWLHWQNGAKG